MDAQQTDEWIEEKMIPYFPLGCLKDIGQERDPIIRPQGIYDPKQVTRILLPKISKTVQQKETALRKDLRIKCAGFGGQGILSLGLMIASMGQLRNINVTWLPSYGPEMRGGTANCSVVLSNNLIGSPIVRETNLLIAMNQPSMDKFLPDLTRNGILMYDSTNVRPPDTVSRRFSVAAAKIAQDIGNIQCANSVLMGAFAMALKGLEKDDYEAVFEEAIDRKFKHRQNLIEMNHQAFHEGQKQVKIEI